MAAILALLRRYTDRLVEPSGAIGVHRAFNTEVGQLASAVLSDGRVRKLV